MDERESDSLADRIKQLENNIQRAEGYAVETEVHLQAVIGSLKITKHDFDNLRKIIK